MNNKTLHATVGCGLLLMGLLVILLNGPSSLMHPILAIAAILILSICVTAILQKIFLGDQDDV